MPSANRSASIQHAFGRALRARRERVGLSQEELGFASEIHRTYISELERGLKNPSLTTIARLADALKTRPSVLVAESESKSR